MAQGNDSSTYVIGRRTGAAYLIGLVAVLGSSVAVVKGFANLGEDGSARPGKSASHASSRPFDAPRFILNALLIPALDTDEVPLRWVDPRPALQCGTGTNVRVNGAPLVPGTLVPVAPFELEWQAQGCRPFGAAGPRLDGGVKLTVFREDWGFTALVKPRGLRVTTNWHPSVYVRAGAATMPQSPPEDEPYPGD